MPFAAEKGKEVPVLKSRTVPVTGVVVVPATLLGLITDPVAAGIDALKVNDFVVTTANVTGAAASDPTTARIANAINLFIVNLRD